MLNLLHRDCYKLLKTKSFLIISSLIAVSAFFTVLNTRKGAEVTVASLIEASFFSSYLLYPILTIIFFVCLEFSCGIMKNIVSRGYSQQNIYLSKLIISFGINIFYILINVLIFLIYGNIVLEFGSFGDQFFLTACKAIMIDFAIASIAVMMSMIIRSTKTTLLAIYIGVIAVMAGVAFWIGRLLEKGLGVQNFFQSLENFYNNHILFLTATFLLGIVLPSALGIWNFKSRDIKTK